LAAVGQGEHAGEGIAGGGGFFGEALEGAVEVGAIGAVGAVEAKIDTKAVKIESGTRADGGWVAHGLRFDAAGRLFVADLGSANGSFIQVPSYTQ
jgi:hypothetical protein